MAIGRIVVDVTGLDRARLLMIELNELERELDLRGDHELASRLGRAISRFSNTDTAKDRRTPPADDDGH